mmetsp:Transcript_48725/g.136312  ORF Transcript_48725/g.136312 Transcript_48725/m.136312 type:complete len:227 (+) Transcript_48725:29-709(+)
MRKYSACCEAKRQAWPPHVLTGQNVFSVPMGTTSWLRKGLLLFWDVKIFSVFFLLGQRGQEDNETHEHHSGTPFGNLIIDFVRKDEVAANYGQERLEHHEHHHRCAADHAGRPCHRETSVSSHQKDATHNDFQVQPRRLPPDSLVARKWKQDRGEDGREREGPTMARQMRVALLEGYGREVDVCRLADGMHYDKDDSHDRLSVLSLILLGEARNIDRSRHAHRRAR